MDKETLIKILIQKDEMLRRLYVYKEKLNYYANTDVMTGVLNRRAGLELFEAKLDISKHNDQNFVI